MADGVAEQDFVEQAQEQGAPGETEAMDEQDAQIDSSDEYDPSAQSFQDVSHDDPSASNVSNDQSASAPNPPSSASPTPANSTPIAAAPEPAEMASTNLATAPSTFPGATDLAAGRLPHDRIGILNDRIEADEKGDLPAWLELINDYKQRGKLDDARKTYERFFAVFPTAADERVAMVQMESDAGNKKNVEAIFNKTLKESASMKLWSTYMNHIRRYHNMTLDKSGKAAQTTYRAYQIVLEAVGQDKDSGSLWQDYLAYLKTTPGMIGGTTWQDNQKMDVLRAAYQQAIVIPHQATEVIWKDYSNFETSNNKQSGRKFLQDKSPEYMQARTAYSQLQNITLGLSRTTLPRLPPAPGFDGHEEYMQQLSIWKKWIEWEKSDPLLIREEDAVKWRNRVVFVYKQALMALRFWPEMWLDAAEFCFDNDLETDGNTFLSQGVDANPESALLAFRKADRLEMSTTNGNDDDSKAARGDQVRAPYDTCLDALYALLVKVKKSESALVASMGSLAMQSTGEDATAAQANGNPNENAVQERVAGIRIFHKAQIDQLQRTIAFVWIALMRSFQRMQGTGNPSAKIGGSRGIFAQARKRGQLTSELFAAAAMLEFHSGMRDASGKIFDRGAKLFPKDGHFALEYVKFLVNSSDFTNARVVFETTVSRLQADEDTSIRATAKPLFAYFHGFESRYGELSQVVKLEARMKLAFPEDPMLGSFASRFVGGGEFNAFNPTGVHQIISPATQCRPRAQPLIHEPLPSSLMPAVSPRPMPAQPVAVNSPKRPLPADLADIAQDRASKVPRGESPLKGAAGRRQAQANAGGTPLMGGVSLPSIGGPPPLEPLPREIAFLLSIIPSANTYQSTRFSPEGMVRLVQGLHIPKTPEELKAMLAAREQHEQQQAGAINGGQGGSYWGQR